MTRADEIADDFRGATADGAATDVAQPHGPLHLTGHVHLPHHRGDDADLEPGAAGDPPETAAETPEAVLTGADAAAEEPAVILEPAPADLASVKAEPDPEPDPKPRSSNPVHSPQHESLPSLARAAAGGILQAAGWTAGTSLRVSSQLRRLAVDPASAQEVIDEVTREVREVARDFLGITELEDEVREMAPLLSSGLLKPGGASPAALRAQGAALLRAAADVGFDESAHPAFARILTELSPDEARILRLLSLEGAQPMVDIRASNLIGNGSQLIAQSLNMLGSKAGLRQRERVPVYLTNLTRLNLVDLSDDPLQSPVEYQLLEAQPEVLATLRDTIRAKTIRRSVRLTPLGVEFCAVCLPVSLPALAPPAPGD